MCKLVKFRVYKSLTLMCHLRYSAWRYFSFRNFYITNLTVDISGWFVQINQ